MGSPPAFDSDFAREFETLLAWRRDVRRFRPEPVPEPLLKHLLALTDLAPSVGYSQPWRWLRVEDPGHRQAAQQSFSRCNTEALQDYSGDRATLYARLKLEGLREAPEQFAVFCDHGTGQGHGLGRRTMPETLDYSVVAAITQFWLAARIYGLGVGWVSILEPDVISAALAVPSDWKLIAWLCVGYPQEEHADPELMRHGWETGKRIAPL